MSITFSANTQVEGPELNLANGNFAVLSQLLQLNQGDYGYAGSITAELLERRIEAARNEMNIHAKEWERTPQEYRGERGAHIIECGLSASQLLRYLERLDAIVAFAKQHNVLIHWA